MPPLGPGSQLESSCRGCDWPFPPCLTPCLGPLATSLFSPRFSPLTLLGSPYQLLHTVFPLSRKFSASLPCSDFSLIIKNINLRTLMEALGTSPREIRHSYYISSPGSRFLCLSAFTRVPSSLLLGRLCCTFGLTPGL